MTNRSQHETEADHSADDEQADKAAALADASPVVIFLVVIAMEGGLFLLALLLGFAFDTPPLARLSPATWPLVGWGVGAALIPALVVILLLRTRVGFALRLLAKARSAMEPLLRLQLWQLALIALTTGLIEEALFRGVLQTAITNVLAVHTDAPMAHVLGVLSGALLFGCAHPASRAYVIVGTLFGVWMGGLLLMTGNLFAPIIAHALYDFVLILYVRYGTLDDP